MVTKERGKIKFHALNVNFTLLNRRKLRLYIASIFKKEKVRLGIVHYVFCSDDYLCSLNKEYLHHDTYTDIITFLLSDTTEPIVGEVYISVDRVKENAVLYESSFKSELHRVIFHGALHLCGYKDKTKSQSGIMRFKEDEHLAAYFVSRGT